MFFDYLRKTSAALVIGLSALGLSVAAGNAATVTFDFTSNGPDNLSDIDFGPTGGVSLNVNAFNVFDPAGGTFVDGNVNQGGNGLGVSGSPEGGRLAGDEALQFTFSPQVTDIEAVVFERGIADEGFLLFDENDVFIDAFTVLGLGGGNSFQTFDFSALGVTTGFTIRGLDPSGTENNEGIR
ncbi:MAG: hypothetical protein AAFW60_12095, partial [Pseudomonadota bacterium]